ncbi:hypothetical protein M6B38_235080 [Iris pallida]|uniref:Uncharacterized protein n=1 Tax=Iris pallida TaxID=29817 RepID=A0AAX6DPL4_IRIPA|nr:hypothetical protein M6B38_235080 [Iris pallida]
MEFSNRRRATAFSVPTASSTTLLFSAADLLHLRRFAASHGGAPSLLWQRAFCGGTPFSVSDDEKSS